jgi:hypothetical protein
MSADGSLLVTILVLAGTTALAWFIRMMGIYGTATHDWALQNSSAPRADRPSRTQSGGIEPGVLVAILTAAAAVELGVTEVKLKSAHELRTNQSTSEWPAHGRQMIFQSHRLRS